MLVTVHTRTNMCNRHTCVHAQTCPHTQDQSFGSVWAPSLIKQTGTRCCLGTQLCGTPCPWNYCQRAAACTTWLGLVHHCCWRDITGVTCIALIKLILLHGRDTGTQQGSQFPSFKGVPWPPSGCCSKYFHPLFINLHHTTLLRAASPSQALSEYSKSYSECSVWILTVV